MLFALVLTVLTAKEMPPQGNCQVWLYFFCPQKKKLTVEIFRSRKIQPLARFTITQGGVFRPQTVSTSEHKNRYLLQINILYSCYNYFKHYVKISLIVFFKHNIVAIFFNDMIGYLCFFH